MQLGSAAAVLAAVVLVAGCTQEEPGDPVTPTGEVPAPTTTASSPAPSPSGPKEVPAAARAQTQQGAEAFIRFYFEELNRALTEPAAGVISGLSDPSCLFCKKAESTAAQLVKDKQRYTAGAGTVDSLVKISGEVNVRLIFAAKQTQNVADIVDENGQVVDSAAEESGDVLVGVSWSAKGWQMYDVEDNTPYESKRPTPTRSKS